MSTPQPVQPGAFTIDEFAKVYRIGRSTVYDAGELRSFYVGRRRLVSYAAAMEWQLKREAAAAEAA
jgi:excisionase family DNA binding protein